MYQNDSVRISQVLCGKLILPAQNCLFFGLRRDNGGSIYYWMDGTTVGTYEGFPWQPDHPNTWSNCACFEIESGGRFVAMRSTGCEEQHQYLCEREGKCRSLRCRFPSEGTRRRIFNNFSVVIKGCSRSPDICVSVLWKPF